MKNPLLINFIILLSFLSTPSFGNRPSDFEWKSVEISSDLNFHLGELFNKEERDEQVRDWILYSILSQENISEEELNDALFLLSPLRKDYLKDVLSFQYGESRSVHLPKGNLLLMVPHKSNNRKELIANEVDKYRMKTGEKVSEILIYDYILKEEENLWDFERMNYSKNYQPAFKFIGSENGKAIFSTEYGYHEVTVKDSLNLKRFISTVDDLTYFKKLDNGILLGGRKYQDKPRTNLSQVELATIYRSYNGEFGAMGFSLDPKRNDEELANDLLESIQDSESFYRKLLEDDFSIKDLMDLREILTEKASLIEESAEEIKDGKRTKFRKFQNQLSGIFEPFDLDSLYEPSWEETLLLNDILEGLGEENDENCLEWEDLNQKIANYKKTRDFPEDESINSWLWKEIVNNSSIRAKKIQVLKRFLWLSKVRGASSCERYNGGIDGTEIGMTMFYTDAMMKLWSGNYKNTTPTHLGMLPENLISWSTSSIHDDLKYEYPATRFWLSPSDNGFNFFKGQEIIFSNVSTQLNARAKPDIYSSSFEEIAPRPETFQFINWWNHHYDKVADYEQQFHKLDQIMKWSLVFLWLDEVGNKDFDFLHQVNINQSLNFKEWYQDNETLKVSDSLPFIEKEGSLCLSYYEGNGISGGVSPARIGATKKPPLNIEMKQGPDGIWRPRYDIKTNGLSRKVTQSSQETLLLNSPKTEVNTKLIELSTIRVGKRVDVTTGLEGHKIQDIHFLPKKTAQGIVIQVNTKLGLVGNINQLLSKLGLYFSPQKAIKRLSLDSRFDKPVVFPDKILSKINNDWTSFSRFSRKNDRLYSKNNTATNILEDLPKIEAELKTYSYWNITEMNGKLITSVSKKAPTFKKSNPKLWKEDKVWLQAGDKAKSIEMVNGLNELHFPRVNLSEPALPQLNQIQQIRMETVRELTKLDSKAEAFYFDEFGKIINLRRVTSSNNKGKLLAREILTPESKVTLINSSNKKGVFLKKGKNLVISENAKSADKAIAIETRKQIDADPSIAKIYEQLGSITAKDNAILKLIPSTQPQMRVAYIQMRGLKPKDIPKNYGVVSLQTQGKQPMFLYRTAKSGVQVRTADIDGLVDFGKPSIEYYKARSTKELRRLTIREVEYLEIVQKEINCKNIVTLESKGRLSASKIWALHRKNPKIKFRKDNPDLKKSVDFYQENIRPDFEKMVILSPQPMEDTVYSYLYKYKTDTLVGASWLAVQNILNNPTKTQIILNLDTEEPDKIIFGSERISYDEFIGFLGNINHTKDLIYILSDDANNLQYSIAGTRKFKRVIANSNSKYGIASLTKYLKKALKSLGKKAKSRPTVDDLVNEIQREGIMEMDANGRNRGRYPRRSSPPSSSGRIMPQMDGIPCKKAAIMDYQKYKGDV